MTAFLGMGLLGSNFVRAMIARGESVQVWNRTARKAAALAEQGAKVLNAVAEAVAGAKYVHLTLKDDAAVDEVLALAEPGLQPGAIIIDHTTTSAEGAAERTGKWREKGFYYQHAPVFMGPQNALEGTGYMLVSGDQELIAQLEPRLAAMTGKVLNFGPQPGKAAGMKLIGNSFLVTFTAGLADTLSLARALDIPKEDVAGLLGEWNPATMVQARIARMTSGDYSKPSWELAMARKDTGLFIETAFKGNTPLIAIPAIAAQMDKWIEKGHGASDWTIIGKDAVFPEEN
ncbi:NAD(P)-dependent oxidoreductase [Chitinophaga lutea]